MVSHAISVPWRRRLAVCVAATAVAVACSDGQGPTPMQQTQATLSSVTVAGASSVMVGATTSFTATANFSNGTSQNVSAAATWSTSNGTFAAVAGGVVTGLAAGNVTIQATHQGMTGSAPLQVTAPAAVPPTAQFTVSGPGGVDACRIIKGSGGKLDCTFDGSASTGGSGGAVTQWTWRFDVGTNSGGPISDDDPTLVPEPGCGFFANKPSQAGTGFVQMIVKLEVRNAAGTVSAERRNSNVRLFPQEECGFGF